MATSFSWTLDQLKHELSSRSEVKAWIISHEHTHRRERYFLLDGATLTTDQDREVHGQSIEARIMVRVPNRPGRQGEISKKLFTALPLAGQLDAAIQAALQTDHQSWELPTEIARNLPQLATSDPRMAEDLERSIGELTERITSCVERKRATTFNSAELFLSIHDRELHLSNGLTHRSSQSRVYAEAAYSFARKDAQGKMHSDEYLNTQWSVSVGDLPIEKLFDETSERAEHSLDVIKPVTGTYPVIVDAEVLATLFNNQISQFSAANSYNGLPFIPVGEELIPGLKGDPLTITLDPHLEHGADTTPLSDQGILQKPTRVVDCNRVTSTTADKRYSDYLHLPTSTTRGNVVVEAGSLSHSELTQHAPRVIEILQFSGLFADPNSGTFSSEIRLAKFYDNEKGTVTYIKGGSLSGAFRENFKAAKLSRERVKRSHFSSGSLTGQGYYGPAYALLSDVSIVG